MAATRVRVVPVTSVEFRRMVAHEFLHDMRLAHPGRRREQQAGHAVARRTGEQFGNALQGFIGAGVVNPAVLLNPGDALGCRLQGNRAKWWL